LQKNHKKNKEKEVKNLDIMHVDSPRDPNEILQESPKIKKSDRKA